MEAMGAITPIANWLQRKKKPFKLATGNYLSSLQESIDKDTEERLERLEQRSIFLEIKRNKLEGLRVARPDLPSAEERQRILLLRKQNDECKEQVASGIIINVNPDEIEFKFDKPLEKGDGDQFKLQFDTGEVSTRRRRIEDAFWRLKNSTRSLYIHKCMLGQYDDSSNVRYSKARGFFLDDPYQPKGQQVLAVEQSLMKRVFLIEGAAGSGKTLVAANIACSMTRLKKTRVLLCSPIQETVDKLTQLIERSSCVQVVQLSCYENEPLKHESLLDIDKNAMKSDKRGVDRKRALDRLVATAIYEKILKRLTQTPTYQTPKELASKERRAANFVATCSQWLRSRQEHKILQQADIVCCTLAQSGSPVLRGIKFDMLIIDDAHLASELDCLIPIMAKGLRQVTLLGEMRRDILLARSDGRLQGEDGEILDEIKTLLRRKRLFRARNVDQAREPGGLFERWLRLGLTSMALNNQHRMHYLIASFPNHQFYSSRLKWDRATRDELVRRASDELMKNGGNKYDWLPKKDHLTALFNRQNNHNDDIYTEVRNIISKIATRSSRIAVICNVPTKSADLQFHGVRVGRVDDFYGQEKDFIILLALEMNASDSNTSTETCNDLNMDCNFLRNELALNIALTRARLGLFIVADLTKLIPHNSDQPIQATSADAISELGYCKSWFELVKFYSSNQLIVN